MDYHNIFSQIATAIAPYKNLGEVANYIPELNKVNPNQFGVCLTTINKETFGYGDFQEPFSIQSIAKVIALVMAYRIEGENLWKRVGVEPSGTPFNSLLQLEKDLGIPRNPLINSGALVISDILVSHFKDPKSEFLKFIKQVSGNNTLDYCSRIAQSEKETGYRNYALVHLMKSFGNIQNDINTVMDFYFHLCSMEMTCAQLSQTFLFLADYGVCPQTNETIITQSMSKRVNAIMQLCGFYDEAGEFSFKVGLPGKSGVGGGIVAIHPGKYSIAVWSPKLNAKGNSQLGIRFLEQFTTLTESIF